MKLIRSFPLEAIIWTGALVFLALIDPMIDRESICPLHAMGFTFCPGCGLGRAISFLFHGDLQNSWNAHPFAIPAIILLILRIIKLTKNHLYYGQNY